MADEFRVGTGRHGHHEGGERVARKIGPEALIDHRRAVDREFGALTLPSQRVARRRRAARRARPPRPVARPGGRAGQRVLIAYCSTGQRK